MKDFLSNKLELGDSVIAPNYRSFVLARVIKFTPKQVKVAFMNTWNFSEPGYYTELLQYPTQLTKVGGADLTAYMLKKENIMNEEMVTITKAEYDQLCNDSAWLSYLEAAGVDNWDGFDEAINMRNEANE